MDQTHFKNLIGNIFKKRRRRSLYLGAFLVIAFLAIQVASDRFLISIPTEGGSFSEALVGHPRFVNPVLALSQTDRDIAQLIFSGLLTQDPSGTYKNDLASEYSVNEDATIHTLTLGANNTFHDGTPVTIDDVLFTYQLIKDPLIKSPLFPRLNNVEISLENSSTIVFTLAEGNNEFQQNLTVGILSKDQWNGISKEEFPFAEKNISPIGTGPYSINSTVRDKQQRISSYVLSAFRTEQSQPYIDTVELKFYENQQLGLQAFEAGLVDNFANISAQELLVLDHTLDQKNIKTSPLPRVFSLFMNQDSNPIFKDIEVRSFVQSAIQSNDIIEQVFFSRANKADGPIPVGNSNYNTSETATLSLEQAKKELEEKSWVLGDDGFYSKASTTLSFTLHVPDVSELVKSASVIKQQLQAAGAQVEIIPVDENNIVDATVRRREFETLLYGQIISTPEQLYAFWHSSGVLDPGVNIAGYKNKTVDAILERIINPSNAGKNEQDYSNLQKEIREDVPVVFLFSPQFIYATDKSIKNNSLDFLEFATDRFRYIESWYIEEELLLPYFIN